MEGNSIKSFENLCKIFEMRVKLDKEQNLETPEDVLINYEKYSKKIDAFYNMEFEKQIRPLISPEVTLESESNRLKKLIKLLEERLAKREELEKKFRFATGKHIKGLQMIISESELNDKQRRLELIDKYLEIKKEVEEITENNIKLNDELLELENKKDKYEEKNKIMEDELYSNFMDIFKSEEYFKNIEEDTSILYSTISEKVTETKETLDITKDTVSSLSVNSSSEDYASYIEEAAKNYFTWKSREILLKIYDLIIETEDEFSEIYEKREKVTSLLEELINIKETLDVTSNIDTSNFEKLLSNQSITLNEEKEILENISNYMSRIKFKEERLEELEEENNSVEILAILREYDLIDTYNNEELGFYEEDEEDEDDIEKPSVIETISGQTDDEIVKEIYDPYRIVEVKDYPKTLNIGLAKLKSENVRERVNKKINSENVNIPFVEEIKIPKPEENIFNIEKQNNIETPIVTSSEIETKEQHEELPTWTIPKSVDSKETIKEENQLWEMPPLKEEINNEEDNFNLFWTPVSESKLESSSFPSINIPIQKSEFTFPNINEG